MASWFLKGQASKNRTRRFSYKSPIRARWIFRRWRRSVLESAAFKEVRPMKSDDRTMRIEPENNRDEDIHVEHDVETEAAEVHEPQPKGWLAQLRQIMHLSAPGAARSNNIKRQQLKEDRTKS